jgi:hypothetical protein
MMVFCIISSAGRLILGQAPVTFGLTPIPTLLSSQPVGGAVTIQLTVGLLFETMAPGAGLGGCATHQEEP